ncbi:MAG TPA: YciI family protein [Solirubrobacteraceae bacterium]|nr:YciI family protein [Solirubrobacteraceae bacterium]
MLFAMIRKGGPGWDPVRPLREQEKWDEHARFMDELAEEGFVVLAGPLGDGYLGHGDSEHRVLLIFEADSEATVTGRLDADPWTRMGVLETVSVERWTVLLGDLTGR